MRKFITLSTCGRAGELYPFATPQHWENLLLCGCMSVLKHSTSVAHIPAVAVV